MRRALQVNPGVRRAAQVESQLTTSYDRRAAASLFANKIDPADRVPIAVQRGLNIVVAQNGVAVLAAVLLFGVIELGRSFAYDGSPPDRALFLTVFEQRLAAVTMVAILALILTGQARRRRRWALWATEGILVWRAWTPLPDLWLLFTLYLAHLRTGEWPPMIPYTGRTVGAFIVWTIGGAIALLYLESRASRDWFRERKAGIVRS